MCTNFKFLTILFIGFIDYIGISLVYPVFAGMLFDPNYLIIPSDSSLAYRGAMLGLLISLTPLMQFISAPLLGMISDLKGRKKTLVYGTLLGTISYSIAMLGVYTQSIFLLFLYRILVGISSGTVPVAQAMIADISTVDNKARRFSLFSASLGAGFTVGPFLGGKLGDPSFSSLSGYAVPFFAASLMCLVSFVIIYWQFSETHHAKKDVKFNFTESILNIQKVFVWPELRWLFLATFCFAFGWSFFNEFSPLLLRDKFNFSLSDVGNYYAYGGVWFALSSSLIAPFVLKYYSMEKIAIKALIGCFFCMYMILFIQNSFYIWFILPPLMFCMSFTFPTTGAMVSNRAGSENQGEVLGVYQSVTGAAMGLSPLFAGGLVGAYPALVAIIGGIAMLLSSVAFWKGTKQSYKLGIKNSP